MQNKSAKAAAINKAMKGSSKGSGKILVEKVKEYKHVRNGSNNSK